MLLTLLLACNGGEPQDSVVDDTAETGDTQDTGEQLGEPALSVDVLVIGSGPAGLSAALTAVDAGATVLVMEMAEEAGGGAEYARNFLIVGTELQADHGVTDSVAIASAEWPVFTEGGDGQDPVVQTYLGETRALADWFMERLGATITGPHGDPSAGETPRIHNFDTGGGATPGQAMLSLLSDWIWVNVRGDSLVVDQDQVIGVRFSDMVTGEQGWVQAGATVVATGGFIRDLDRIFEQRPELEGLEVVFETHHLALGEGLDMLEGVGAGFQNHGAVGVYVHSSADPRPGFEDEALWYPTLRETMIVDETGRRVADENTATTFGMDDVLLASAGQRLWAFYPEQVWDRVEVLVPVYNGEEDNPGVLSTEEVEALGVVHRGSAEDLALELGISLELLNTIEGYNDFSSSGVDLDFGKLHWDLVPFGEQMLAFELLPGVAKCFTGVALSADGEVLDESGAPIPGLYGAGEVAGMLGSPAIGQGYSGTISAVYWTGRRAGASATAYAAQ